MQCGKMVAVMTKNTKFNEGDLVLMPSVGVAEIRRLRTVLPDAYVVGFVGVLRTVYERADSITAMRHSSTYVRSWMLSFIISARSLQSFSNVKGSSVRWGYKPQIVVCDASLVVGSAFVGDKSLIMHRVLHCASYSVAGAGREGKGDGEGKGRVGAEMGT